MNTIGTASASVIGARHARAARNGQDAVASAMVTVRATGERAAVAVVCDGCSSGASSEVGAQLGASLFARAVASRLAGGQSPCDPGLWADARAEVVAQLGALADRMLGRDAAPTERAVGARDDLAEIVREHFLFTVVAAAVRGDAAAVWAVGDGVYSYGDHTCVLGPFADNAPPYLGYDLLGDERPAHFEIAAPGCGVIVIGTDGAGELIDGVARFAGRSYVEHPDALRRELSLRARPQERIDWEARRVVRTPAELQDDCAIAVLRWEPERVFDNLVIEEQVVS
jgi:hypothetical protein